MTDLAQAIAGLRIDGPTDAPWTSSQVADGHPHPSKLAEHVATILNAAISSDLIPRADHDLAVALMVERAATHVRTAEVPREETGEGAMQRALLNYAADVVSLSAPASALAELQALRDDVTGWISNAQVAREKWSEYEARAEAAEADITTYQKIVADMTQEAEAAEAELAALRAQVERLTGALGDMVGLFSADNVLRKGTHMNATLKLARAAIEGAKP